MAADCLRPPGHFLDFSAGSGFHFSVPEGVYIELLQEVKPWMQSTQPAHAEQRYYSSPSRLRPQEGLSVAFVPATVNCVGLCAWASVSPFSSPILLGVAGLLCAVGMCVLVLASVLHACSLRAGPGFASPVPLWYKRNQEMFGGRVDEYYPQWHSCLDLGSTIIRQLVRYVYRSFRNIY